MNKKLIFLLTFSLAFSLAFKAAANISSDLNNFLNNVGYASNATSPAAFESQAAGYFGGGSLYVRNQVRQYQLVYLDLPSYRAGCNGIDLINGSLSFISSKKLVDLGKQVMTSAGAYAVDVMLAATVPQLKQVRDYLQQMQQKINQSTINTCQLAQNLVGGVLPKTDAIRNKICQDQITNDGAGADYVKARMDCANKDNFDNAMDKASKNDRYKKQLLINKNLVWSILQDKSFFATDSELAEMVMSLTGTVIFDKNGKITYVPSLADSPDLINALLGTQTHAKIWKCTEAGSTSSCLTVKLTEVQIAENSSLINRIRKYIRSINDKIIADQDLTAEEKNFLNLTNLQPLKYLTVLNSAHYGAVSADVEEYATLIAHDLLQRYLAELLQEVANASQMAEFQDDWAKNIEERIDKARNQVATLDPKVGNKLKEKLLLINNIARVEKQVAAILGEA